MKVIDMHCDTIMGLYFNKDKHLRDYDGMISLEKMQKGDYMAQCFAMFVPYENKRNKDYNPFEMCMGMIDRYYEEIEKNKDIILPAFSYDDIIRNTASGKMSAILTIEEGGVTKGNLAFLRDFYRLGVRMICLNWNYVNGVGHPNYSKYDENGKPDYFVPNTTDGLTDYGKEMVKEMNRLGIVVDCSHLSDKGFYDVCEISTKPFVCSHSNARSVCGHVRNLTDDMIRLLASKGGVTGINYCADFIDYPDDNGKCYGTVKKMVEHINHIVSVGGIDCVGLGSDFDGIDNNLEMNDCSKLGMLRQALEKEGYSEEDIDKIFYKNVLRVFKEVLK